MSRGVALALIIIGCVISALTWLLWFWLTALGCGYGATSPAQCDFIWLTGLFNQEALHLFWPYFLVGVALAVWGWRARRPQIAPRPDGPRHSGRWMLAVGVGIAVLSFVLWIGLFGCGFNLSAMWFCVPYAIGETLSPEALGLFWPLFLGGVALAIRGAMRMRMRRWLAIPLMLLGAFLCFLGWFITIYINGYACAWGGQRNCPIDWFSPEARYSFWPLALLGGVLIIWGLWGLWRRR
ncbi:MAG: hypothetical protein Q4G22_04075 [Paracoccus sp. (in: a-proteobacteria)]|uniref:hypothetical protein n=1 Tax=Paracoccus sp. TaxID=267 RepID=UPI0026E055F7|nr:hypothetical protein [Paracoccus sp. (in: a-proteobacteria)]MDO5630995.1 hypothetical protein [Paracoccus sp. (in: a-proteobacteria)]